MSKMIPIRSAKEIEAMRRSGRVLSEIIDRLVALVRPGITTLDLDAAAAKMFREAGGKSAFYNYRGFPGHICSSVNEGVIHGIPNNRRLMYGDVVKIDTGLILGGWITDTAVSIPVGAVTPEIDRLLSRTQEALTVGIAQARAGNRLGDISNAIERCIRGGGYSIVEEFVGHGVGRKLHEEPQIPNFGKAGSGPLLKPGMTLAIEPMVNMGRKEVRVLQDKWTVVTTDNRHSAHFEHTVLITEDEPEILTRR